MDNIENQLSEFKNKTNEEIEQELLKAYKNAEQFSLIPLLKLIYLTTKIDLYKDFKLKYKLNSSDANKLKAGEVIMTKDNKKVKVYLDIVDKDYNLSNTLNSCEILSENIINLNNETNEQLKNQIIYIITLLTQAAKAVFDQLKTKYKELAEFNLTLSENTTIYLDYELNKRIGIKFELIN